MSSLLQYNCLINLFHILVVAPLLWALATDKLSENQKQYVVWLAVVLVIYHLYRLMTNCKQQEHMQNVYGSNIHHVKMFDSAPGYDRVNVTIKRGDIVVWTNVGEIEHTITADRGEFNSGYLKPGENYSVKFDNLGEYYYHCENDIGWMKGSVTVIA